MRTNFAYERYIKNLKEHGKIDPKYIPTRRQFSRMKSANKKKKLKRAYLRVKERMETDPEFRAKYLARKKTYAINARNNNRRYNLVKYNLVNNKEKYSKCVICQYDIIIHIHHIDQNHYNNKVENLIPLCPNHHSQAHLKTDKNSITIEQLKEYWKKLNIQPLEVEANDTRNG